MSQVNDIRPGIQPPDLTPVGVPGGMPPAVPAGAGGAAQPLPPGLDPPATFAGARAEAVRNIPQQTHLRGAAAPGRNNFFAAIANFFAGVLSKVPDRVTAQMPGGGTVTFSGKSLETMVSAVPAGQRRDAVDHLGQTLTERIAHGKHLYDEAVQGQAGPPGEDDVADLMLYVKAKAMSQGHQFTNGAYSIEDPQGDLAHWLDSCPERYQRTSTHLDEMQRMTVDGHVNTHRGIDFHPSHAMPDGHQTVLFGTIPPFGSEPRRLFLKTETYGARISTLGPGARASGVGQGMQQDRGLRLRDVGQAVSHLGSLISSKFASSGGTKRERIPDAVKNQYKEIMKGWKGRDGDVHAILAQGTPTAHGGGIRVMLANLDQAIRHVREHPSPAGGEADLLMLRQEKDVLTALIPDRTHLGARIGNEVMFQENDL